MQSGVLGYGQAVISGPSAAAAFAVTENNFPGGYSTTREEIKNNFYTREGLYRVMPLAEYSRPSRIPGPAGANVLGGAVRVSFLTGQEEWPNEPVRNNGPAVSATEQAEAAPGSSDSDEGRTNDRDVSDRICFNVGRELYVYHYKGPSTTTDLNHPIDKRVYKVTFPTCHDFNQETATANSCSLIIGFSFGQIQLIDPHNKDYTPSRLFNEERFIEKSAVTCVKWVPSQPTHFLVSYASGNMYLYNEDLQSPPMPPIYQLFTQGDKFSVYTCKAKSTRNPVYKWQIGFGSINQFAFSDNEAKMLATVGNDGYLRIFNYHQMELLSFMKSYFGGISTLSWSPDSKLIATGGEDDLLTVYHVQEKRVVCRGQGHKSWIAEVAFDPYTSQIEPEFDINGVISEAFDDEGAARGDSETCPTPAMRGVRRHLQAGSRCSFASFGTLAGTGHTGIGVCYRIGSVGHDTQLCLWDITDDMLKSSNVQRHRNSTIIAPSLGIDVQMSPRLLPLSEVSPASSHPEKPKKKRFHKRGLTLGRIGASSADRRALDSPAGVQCNGNLDDAKLLGTRACPRMEDVPVVEPLVCKKIAHERLTSLKFRRDCIVTACQEGFICTWARPNKGLPSTLRRDLNSPTAISPQNEDVPRSWSHQNTH